MKAIIDKKKILVFAVTLILISTAFTSLVGSKSTCEPLIQPKPRPSPLGNFLQNLVDHFPALGGLRIIQRLLEFLNEGDDGDNDPPNMCNPDVEVVKQVKFNCNGTYDTTIIVDVGSWVTFKIVVENTGQTPLNITVRDNLPDGIVYNNNAYINGVLTPPDEIGGDYYWYLYDIMPDETVTITFRADVPECGEFENYVNVTAEYDGVIIYDDATAIVIAPCDGTPDIKIEKTVSPESICAGQSVDYSYKITNNGDLDLINIALTDNQLGGITLPKTTLIPMEYMTVTVEDVVLYEDTTNIATVTAETCDEQDVTDESQAFVDVLIPSIDLVKEADVDVAEVGDTITYTYTVTNDGEVGLSGVSVEDDLLGHVTLGTTTLAPMQSTTGVKTYLVKTSDLPGPIINHAIATGIADCNCQEVTDEDDESVRVEKPCAPEVWVDDNWFSQTDVNTYNPTLVWGYTAFRTIQDGIDAVCPCGTVHVRPGLYVGQILINKDLDLLGEPGARINGNLLRTFTIDGSGSFRPIIFAFAGTLVGNDVHTNGHIGVKVDGFEIHGGAGDIAILYHNVEDTCKLSQISNNTITGVTWGVQINGCTDQTRVYHNKMPWENSGHTAVLITTSAVCDQQPGENFIRNINHNYWGAPCSINVGVNNQGGVTPDARYNWWNRDDGPSSPDEYDNYDAITGRIADGIGDKVIGPVQFDPWYGVDSNGSASTYIAHVGELIIFDGSSSFGYDENGYIPDVAYKWDFDDGHYSFSRYIRRSYAVPGIYHVSLFVEVSSYDLDHEFVSGFLRDWSYFTVIVTP